MRRITSILVILLISSIAFGQTLTKNRPIPVVRIKDIRGNPFSTDSIKNNGKPIIISFWATWCKPCIAELTTIGDVYSEWQEETGVKIYAVSIDDARRSNDVAPLVNGKGWEYVVLLDPNSEFKRAMNVGPIPHTFLINGKGEIVWQHTSFAEGSELELINLVRKLNNGEEVK